RLLRVLELCLEAHDAVEHLVQRRQGVAPFEPGAKLRREPGGIAAQDRVRLHRDRLGLRPSGGRQGHGVGAGNRSRAADGTERVFLLLDAGATPGRRGRTRICAGCVPKTWKSVATTSGVSSSSAVTLSRTNSPRPWVATTRSCCRLMNCTS